MQAFCAEAPIEQALVAEVPAVQSVDAAPPAVQVVVASAPAVQAGAGAPTILPAEQVGVAPPVPAVQAPDPLATSPKGTRTGDSYFDFPLTSLSDI